MAITPYYDEPYIAYAVRILAWQKFIAKDQSSVTDDELEQLIRRVLREFGDINRSNPTIYKYAQCVREYLNKSTHEPESWDGKEWYLLYAPFHEFVRRLSLNPVVQGPVYNSYEMTLRDPAVPALKITVGDAVPDEETFEDNPRVIYILRHEENDEEKMYIGMTDNNAKRIQQHIRNKSPRWWFIAQPLDNRSFDTSVQEATESMLMGFWNEIANIANGRIGTSTQPLLPDRQQTTLLTSAISASYLWFVREQQDVRERLQISKSNWEIPLKKWQRTDFDGYYVHFKSDAEED